MKEDKQSWSAYTSPGLFAAGPGMFSHSGVTVTRFILHSTAGY